MDPANTHRRLISREGPRNTPKATRPSALLDRHHTSPRHHEPLEVATHQPCAKGVATLNSLRPLPRDLSPDTDSLSHRGDLGIRVRATDSSRRAVKTGSNPQPPARRRYQRRVVAVETPISAAETTRDVGSWRRRAETRPPPQLTKTSKCRSVVCRLLQKCPSELH